MTGESIAVQLARVDEQLKMVLVELKDSKESRGKQYDAIDALRISLNAIGTRVENVETKLASAQPTIEEFITIKHKVVGAGQLGRWIWLAGAFLLGATAASRSAVIHLISGK